MTTTPTEIVEKALRKVIFDYIKDNLKVKILTDSVPLSRGRSLWTKRLRVEIFLKDPSDGEETQVDYDYIDIEDLQRDT